jgi:hypothetical protein
LTLVGVRLRIRAKASGRKAGTLAKSIGNANTTDAAMTAATAESGSGAVAIPSEARAQASAKSTAEEPTNQRPGREDQIRRRSRQL